MALDDVLLKIKSKFDRNGADQASASVDKLESSTKRLDSTTRKHTKSAEQQAREVRDASGSLGDLRAAADGAGENIINLTSDMGGFALAVGKATAAAGAFWAGWQKGLQIQQKLWDKFVGSVDGIGPPIARTKEQFEELNKVKLDALKEEIDSLKSGLDETIGRIDEASKRASMSRDAETALAVANIKASMPAGDERDRRIAEVEAGARREDIEAEIQRQRKVLAARKDLLGDIPSRREAAQAEITKAREDVEAVRQRIIARKGSGDVAMGVMAAEANNRLRAAEATFSATIQSLDREMKSLAEEIVTLQTSIKANETKLSAAQTTQTAQRQDWSTADKAAAWNRKKDTLADMLGEPGDESIARFREALSELEAEAAAAQKAYERFRETGEMTSPSGGTIRLSKKGRRYRDRLAALKAKAGTEASEAQAAAQNLDKAESALQTITDAVESLDSAIQSASVDQESALGDAVSGVNSMLKSFETLSSTVVSSTEAVDQSVGGMVDALHAMHSKLTNVEGQVRVLRSQIKNMGG